MSQNQTLANPPVDPAADSLWQEFFTVAQKIGQYNASLADKAQAITQLGLHYHMRSLLRKLAPTLNHKVALGPFAGLQLSPAAEHMSACVARLLGLYEWPLHGALEAAIARNYDTLINIGAGEGYYAVGMARRLPQLRVVAADSNPDMQKACLALAQLNNVAERLHITGTIQPAAIAAASEGRTLIICDIEGAEEELLQPAAIPTLRDADLIVELHDVYRPQISDRMAAIFQATHSCTLIDNHNSLPSALLTALKPLTQNLSELEQTLLTYEGRAGPTPWGIFIRR